MVSHQAQLMQTGNTIHVSSERGICQSNALGNTWATKQLRAVQLRKETPLPSAVTNSNLSPSPKQMIQGSYTLAGQNSRSAKNIFKEKGEADHK